MDEAVESIAPIDVFARVEVASLFKHLRAEEQSALTLCLAHDFSHAEAAETLGIPIGTVKSLIARARAKIGDLHEKE